MRARKRQRERLAAVIEQYAHEAVKDAKIEVTETGELYASIPGFVGVWATGEDEDALMVELESVVRGWTMLKVRDGDRDLPVVANLDLRPV